MINIWEVNETNEMIEKENLDVRTITLGISLLDCIDSDLDKLNQKIYNKITTVAKDLVAVGKEIEATTKEILEILVDEDAELISLYYGEDVNEEDAERFAAEIEELYPDVDVDAQFGGQPIYYYVLAVE